MGLGGDEGGGAAGDGWWWCKAPDEYVYAHLSAGDKLASNGVQVLAPFGLAVAS